MSYIEQAVNAVGVGTAGRIAFEESGGLCGLHQFEAGDSIVIDLIGEQCEGVKIEEDQIIVGQIIDNRQSIIDVFAASHQPELAGRHIGLATATDLSTPVGFIVRGTLKYCVGPQRTMAYYFPEDIAPDGLPTQDAYHYLAARYGRIVVAGEVFFDVLDS